MEAARPWTTKEVAILKSDMPIPEIAQKLNRTVRAVTNKYYKEFGAQKLRHWTFEEVYAIFNSGKSDKELAEELGRSEASIRTKRYKERDRGNFG